MFGTGYSRSLISILFWVRLILVNLLRFPVIKLMLQSLFDMVHSLAASICNTDVHSVCTICVYIYLSVLKTASFMLSHYK